MKLLTPGPVQIPKEVIEAFGKQPLFHKLQEFKEVFREVLEKLSKVVMGTPIVLPGTGTLAVDTMVYNYVNPGERVIALTYGEFGDRLIESLESRGAKVFRLSVGIGRVPPPDVVEDLGRRLGDVVAIALVHNETGAGCVNRYLDKLRDVANSLGTLLLVDSVSGVPAEPIRCCVDVVATASQKAFLAPPGGAILYVNTEPRAKYPVPRSMNLSKFLNSIKDFETPYTPPINVIYGLNASLDYILDMGLENYHEVHRVRAEYLYNNLRLTPVAERSCRSCTVTAFYTDRAREIIDLLRRYGYVIASGVGSIKDYSVRIGVMGDVSIEDLKVVTELVNEYVGK
jgi:aspartate aminotransferase-like enzyme